ncbi:hypothetical protein O6H91_04G063300 [Diphasiastrum complanatum]|uniref:Uncharacterized protein n=1 Tax=Diphasiastrum complanatum TaxID=34168 RepID=A0ACC2DXI1_DIPCM|nr:hypothetical protein O6H91_04G063300 [Diphasiastrum complanatum]
MFSPVTQNPSSSSSNNNNNNKFFCAVKRKEAKLVAPALPPPARDGIYWLSNLDDIPTILNMIFFYQSNKISNTTDPVMVIQNALAEILVHYYPLAGRLELSSEGKFEVINSGEGAVFVEAETDASISDVLAEYNLDTNMEFLGKLFYNSAGESKNILDQPLLAIQPALDRTLLKARDPIQIEMPLPEYTEIYQSNPPTAQDPNIDDKGSCPLIFDSNTCFDDMVFSSLYFDSKTVALLKNEVLDEGILKTCTSFEAMIAFIWRIQTKALGMASCEMTKILFAVDGRSRFCPPLPEGYHGNAILIACAITSTRELIDRELSYAVGLVQEAKVMINDKYMRARIDYLEKMRPRPSLKATLIISSLCGIPFHKADYGWGECTHYFRFRQPIHGAVYFLANGNDRKGIRVLTSLPSFAWSQVKSLLQQQRRNLEFSEHNI